MTVRISVRILIIDLREQAAFTDHPWSLLELVEAASTH
jgi:hypothetical protein